jgi:hypothetical protein
MIILCDVFTKMFLYDSSLPPIFNPCSLVAHEMDRKHMCPPEQPNVCDMHRWAPHGCVAGGSQILEFLPNIDKIQWNQQCPIF